MNPTAPSTTSSAITFNSFFNNGQNNENCLKNVVEYLGLKCIGSLRSINTTSRNAIDSLTGEKHKAFINNKIITHERQGDSYTLVNDNGRLLVKPNSIAIEETRTQITEPARLQEIALNRLLHLRSADGRIDSAAATADLYLQAVIDNSHTDDDTLMMLAHDARIPAAREKLTIRISNNMMLKIL